MRLQNCTCEFEEDVNHVAGSHVRVHRLVKMCAPCQERNAKTLEDDKKRRIETYNEQIRFLEVDIQSAKTLGYDDVVAKKQELIDVFKKQVAELGGETPVAEEAKPKRSRKKKESGDD